MKAIWSFWSKPFLERRSFWRSDQHHWLSWILSTQLARKHFPRTALYTDDAGKEILVNELGLEFGEVSTCLNELAGDDPAFWCLGKILAYSVQEEPFVHLDSDVFLWNSLPDRLTAADVLAQNSEEFRVGEAFYRPEEFESAVQAMGGWVPREFAEYGPRDGMHRAFCCGIFGGCRVDFIRHYARQARRMAGESVNRPIWLAMPDRNPSNMLVEQYVLAACLDYHQRREDSPYAGVRIECLFNDFGDAFQRGDELGFTHLLGEAKQNSDILARLETRVRNDYPAYYERCMEWHNRSYERALLKDAASQRAAVSNTPCNTASG